MHGRGGKVTELALWILVGTVKSSSSAHIVNREFSCFPFEGREVDCRENCEFSFLTFQCETPSASKEETCESKITASRWFPTTRSLSGCSEPGSTCSWFSVAPCHATPASGHREGDTPADESGGAVFSTPRSFSEGKVST